MNKWCNSLPSSCFWPVAHVFNFLLLYYLLPSGLLWPSWEFGHQRGLASWLLFLCICYSVSAITYKSLRSSLSFGELREKAITVTTKIFSSNIYWCLYITGRSWLMGRTSRLLYIFSFLDDIWKRFTLGNTHMRRWAFRVNIRPLSHRAAHSVGGKTPPFLASD